MSKFHNNREFRRYVTSVISELRSLHYKFTCLCEDSLSEFYEAREEEPDEEEFENQVVEWGLDYDRTVNCIIDSINDIFYRTEEGTLTMGSLKQKVSEVVVEEFSTLANRGVGSLWVSAWSRCRGPARNIAEQFGARYEKTAPEVVANVLRRSGFRVITGEIERELMLEINGYRHKIEIEIAHESHACPKCERLVSVAVDTNQTHCYFCEMDFEATEETKRKQ